MKYIDVTRTTHVSLDVLLVEVYWNVDEDRDLSDALTGFHKIYFTECEAIWRKDMVEEETYKETNNLSSRQCMARYVEAYVWCIEAKSGAKVGCRETEIW